MPTIDLVSIDELDSAIVQTLAKVNAGVAAARAQGIQAELPAKIDFEVNVFTKWQALDIVTTETGNDSEKTTSTETGGTRTQDTTEEASTRNTNGRNTHVQDGDQNQKSYQ